MTVKKTCVNDQIQAQEIRLIDHEGNQAGVMSRTKALEMADEVNLDLVEISPNAEPPVCRIMDYGKFLFEQSKRKSSQKQKQIQLKEVKFRPTTDIGDFNVKVRKINEFLERGDKVKVSLRFRGREMQHKDLGMDLIERIKGELPEGYSVVQEPKFEGRQMSMVVILSKNGKKQ